MRIVVLGAGAWGTALAIALARRHEVSLWARDPEQVAGMNASRLNQRYLPEAHFPDNLSVSNDLDALVAGGELLILAVPISALRSTLARLPADAPPLLWLCKGFESGTGLLPHQVVEQVLPVSVPRGVLSGPSFAQEVAAGLPTVLTLASSDGAFAQRTTQAICDGRLRVYSSTDVVGVEVGGAVKNVMAIAAGIGDGLGMGLNARAALITRGLAEVTRLSLGLGGSMESVNGLAGVGDLILTCTGNLSRNRQVGMLLAQGQSLPDILKQLGHVAEGVYSVVEVRKLAHRLGVEMPICEAVYRVLHEGVPAARAAQELLSRAPGSECGW